MKYIKPSMEILVIDEGEDVVRTSSLTNPEIPPLEGEDTEGWDD